VLDELEWVVELLGWALVEEELERAVEEAGTLLECTDELKWAADDALELDGRVEE
jgi:hypothetical protein